MSNNLDIKTYLELAERILRKIAYDYAFAYYEADDIVQEGLLIAEKNYCKWDGVRCPEKFLFVNLSSRLKSLYREKCCRSDSPCKICQNGESCDKTPEGKHHCDRFTKWQNTQNKRRNIVNMAPIKTNDKGETNDESFLTRSDIVTASVEHDDFNEVVRSRLTEEAQVFFDIVMCGEKISERNLQKLQSQVRAILEGMKIGGV